MTMVSNSLMSESLGEEIARRRREIGLSQDALARLLGVSKNTIQNIESGRTMGMNPQQAAGMAVHLRVPAQERTEFITRLTSVKGRRYARRADNTD